MKIVYRLYSRSMVKDGNTTKNTLTVYDFKTGNKLFSTPFMEKYSGCEFGDNDDFICVAHKEKETVKITYKTI